MATEFIATEEKIQSYVVARQKGVKGYNSFFIFYLLDKERREDFLRDSDTEFISEFKTIKEANDYKCILFIMERDGVSMEKASDIFEIESIMEDTDKYL